MKVTEEYTHREMRLIEERDDALSKADKLYTALEKVKQAHLATHTEYVLVKSQLAEALAAEAQMKLEVIEACQQNLAFNIKAAGQINEARQQRDAAVRERDEARAALVDECKQTDHVRKDFAATQIERDAARIRLSQVEAERDAAVAALDVYRQTVREYFAATDAWEEADLGDSDYCEVHGRLVKADAALTALATTEPQ